MKYLSFFIICLLVFVPLTAFAVDPRILVKDVATDNPFELRWTNGTYLFQINNGGSIVTGKINTYQQLPVNTADRVVVTNSSGYFDISAITTTLLNYLSGLTGNIQVQLDTKYDNIGPVTTSSNATLIKSNSTTGDLLLKNLAGTSPIQVDNGTDTVIISCPTCGAGSGFTNIASAPQTSATILADNSTVANSAVFKTLTQGTDIVITNGSQAVTIAADIANIHTINNVTSTGCAVGQILKVSGTTWNCAADDNSGGSGFTNITPVSTSANNTLIVSNGSNTAIFKNLAAGTGLTIDNGTDTVTFFNTFAQQANTYTNSGLQNFSSSSIAFGPDPADSGTIQASNTDQWCWEPTPSGTDLCISTNIFEAFTFSTSWVAIDLNSNLLYGGLFDDRQSYIDGTDNTKRYVIDAGFITTAHTQNYTAPDRNGTLLVNVTPVSNTVNATIMQSNGTGNLILKNLSGINGTSIDNGTDTVIIKQTYINSLSANVTTSLGGTDYAQIFRIPLTANSGNALSGVLVMTMASAGVAPQLTANVTNTNTSGQCAFSTPATVSTSVLAHFSMNSSNPTTDTATTTPYPLSAGNGTVATWECSIVTGATPGDFRLLFQSETAGTAVEIKKGSYYIKTP